MPGPVRLLLWLVGFLVLGVAALAGGYYIDRAVNENEVVHNVTVEGKPVGRLGEADVAAVVAELAGNRENIQVAVVLPDLELTTSAADLGFFVNQQEAVAEIMALNRSDGLVDDFRAWWDSLWATTNVELTFGLDGAGAASFVADHPERIHRVPVEPRFDGTVDGFDVVEPVTGQYLDSDIVYQALDESLRPSLPPREIEIPWAVEDTEFSQSDLYAALGQAERLSNHLAVTVNDRPALISGNNVRSWITSDVVEGELVPRFVSDRVEPYLETRLSTLATDPGKPTFEVLDDGSVLLTEIGEPARTCCGDGVTEMLYEAASNGHKGSVALPTRLVDADGGRARAEALGVREMISEFTTFHNCCESRVANIHRIADLVRGQLIAPGESLSINELIGPRTRENGFVGAGAIRFGHLTQEVGGGISQFATTMFNAAFFAGLDFAEYQSHTIYFSRYPRGREATLGFPAPDLEVVNNTPYGVLVWTSYTESSITVQMYSTPYFQVEQTGQASGRAGVCTRVTTFRERVSPDGMVVKDSVFATYRPSEGVDCAGNPTPEPD